MSLRYDKNQYAREYAEKHRSYERLVLPYFRKALRLTYRDIANQITEGGVILLSSMLPMMIKKTWFNEAYQKAWEEVGVRHARWTEKWIKRIVTQKAYLDDDEYKAIAFRSEFFRRLMREFYYNESSTLIQGVTDNTVKIIRRLLVEAETNGLSLLQQAEFIASKLNDKDFSEARAMVISRTESTRGSNKGTQLAAENSDYVTEKGWVYINDHRTRAGHRSVGNKGNIPLDEMFEVPKVDGAGVDLMEYPGDPKAPADQTVSCRCTQIIVPVTDDSGVPVMRV